MDMRLLAMCNINVCFIKLAAKMILYIFLTGLIIFCKAQKNDSLNSLIDTAEILTIQQHNYLNLLMRQLSCCDSNTSYCLKPKIILTSELQNCSSEIEEWKIFAEYNLGKNFNLIIVYDRPTSILYIATSDELTPVITNKLIIKTTNRFRPLFEDQKYFAGFKNILHNFNRKILKTISQEKTDIAPDQSNSSVNIMTIKKLLISMISLVGIF